MKKSFLFIAVLTQILLSCQNSKTSSHSDIKEIIEEPAKPDTIEQIVEEPKPSRDTIPAFELTTYDDHAALYNNLENNLLLDTIDAITFQKIKRSYHQLSVYSPASKKGIQRPDTFSLTTSNYIVEFITEDSRLQRPKWRYINKGKINPLSAYLLIRGTVVGQTLLVDSITNSMMVINGPYDNTFEEALPSPNGKLLLMYGNDLYSPLGASISILTTDKGDTSLVLFPWARYVTEDFVIDEAAWVNDSTAAIKIYTKTHPRNSSQFLGKPTFLKVRKVEK